MGFKELERLAADSENRTIYFEYTANITVDITVGSKSVITQKKQSGNEEYHQVNNYDENEADKSNKETNRNPIEQITSNQVEQIASKKMKP